MLLYKCCYICVQDSVFGAISISRQIHNRENLGQTSGNYPIYRQNLGWSAKSRIPNRLGFYRHMKNRLHPIYRQNLEWPAKSKIVDRLGFFRHMKNRLYFCEFTSLMADQQTFPQDFLLSIYSFSSYGMEKLGKIRQLR